MTLGFSSRNTPHVQLHDEAYKDMERACPFLSANHSNSGPGARTFAHLDCRPVRNWQDVLWMGDIPGSQYVYTSLYCNNIVFVDHIRRGRSL
jgi:hypothetical protein